MFNQQELQILLGGVNSPIDLEDLRKHTNYGGLFNEQDSTIQMFWKVSQTHCLRLGTYCPNILHLSRLSTRLIKNSAESFSGSRQAVVGHLYCKMTSKLVSSLLTPLACQRIQGACS